MALAKYIGRKVAWTLVVFFVALLLNFLLPRLIPGNPVDAIVGQLARGGGAGGEQLEQIHEHYMAGVRPRQAVVAAVLHLRRQRVPGQSGHLVCAVIRRRSAP